MSIGFCGLLRDFQFQNKNWMWLHPVLTNLASFFGNFAVFCASFKRKGCFEPEQSSLLFPAFWLLSLQGRSMQAEADFCPWSSAAFARQVRKLNKEDWNQLFAGFGDQRGEGGHRGAGAEAARSGGGRVLSRHGRAVHQPTLHAPGRLPRGLEPLRLRLHHHQLHRAHLQRRSVSTGIHTIAQATSCWVKNLKFEFELIRSVLGGHSWDELLRLSFWFRSRQENRRPGMGIYFGSG